MMSSHTKHEGTPGRQPKQCNNWIMCPGGTTDQDITLLISPKKGQCGVLLSQTNLLKLDRVQNEAMPVILRTTKDTPTETVRFMPDLSPMQTRQKVEQVKAYFSAIENPHNPLHKAVKDTKGCLSLIHI